MYHIIRTQLETKLRFFKFLFLFALKINQEQDK